MCLLACFLASVACLFLDIAIAIGSDGDSENSMPDMSVCLCPAGWSGSGSGTVMLVRLSVSNRLEWQWHACHARLSVSGRQSGSGSYSVTCLLASIIMDVRTALVHIVRIRLYS